MHIFGYHIHKCNEPMDGASPLDVENYLMLVHLIERIKKMSVELDNLTAQVKANGDAVDSAVALINGIAARITAAGVDPTKLKALTDELKAKDDDLAAAVVANTPAA